MVDSCKPKCPAPCHRKTKGLLLSIYVMLLCHSFISVCVTPWIVRHTGQWMLGLLVMLESGWAAVLLLTSLGLCSPVSPPGFTALQGIVNQALLPSGFCWQCLGLFLFPCTCLWLVFTTSSLTPKRWPLFLQSPILFLGSSNYFLFIHWGKGKKWKPTNTCHFHTTYLHSCS